MSTATRHLVRIGESQVISPPDRMETVLGSCLGLVLYLPTRSCFAMAHIVMPRRTNASGPASRYASEAPAHLLKGMQLSRTERLKVKALVVGGGHLHESGHHVGDSNLAATRTVLKALGIRVLRKAVGGEIGRKLVVDAPSRVVRVLLLEKSGTVEVHKWKLIR